MACNSLSYTPFDSVLLCLYLCVSFDFFEVGVLDIVGFVAAGLLAACLLTAVELVAARLSGSTALLVHLL